MRNKQYSRPAAPAYMSLGVEPLQAGVSLLHDKSGIPLVPPSQKKFKEPKGQFINSKPVIVQASKETSKVKFGSPNMQRTIHPTIPVQVGNHEDQMWFNDKNSISASKVVDNNEDVDIESLQDFHQNTYSKVTSETKNVIDTYVQHLDSISKFVEDNLPKIQTVKDLEALKSYVFSNDIGPFSSVINEISKLPEDQKKILFEIVNDTYQALVLFFDGKQLEFETENDSDIKNQAQHIQEQAQQLDDNQVQLIPVSIIEGQYAILVQGRPIAASNSQEEVVAFVNKLVLSQNVSVSNISVIKRLKTNFGVTVQE